MQIELLPWRPPPPSDRADAKHLPLCRPIQRRRRLYWFLPFLLDCIFPRTLSGQAQGGGPGLQHHAIGRKTLCVER